MDEFNKQENKKDYKEGDDMGQNSSNLKVRSDVSIEDIENQNQNTSNASSATSHNQSLSTNELFLTLSQTLASKLRQLAHHEGLSTEDLAKELISEGITQRVIADGNSSLPNHCITRTGYVPSDVGGYKAPQLSHHQDYNSHQQKRPHKWNGNNFRNNSNRNSMNYKNYNNQQRISSVKAQKNNQKFSSPVNALNQEFSKETSEILKQK